MAYHDGLRELNFLHMGKKYHLAEAGRVGLISPTSMRRIQPSGAHASIFFSQLFQLVSTSELKKFLKHNDNHHYSRDDTLIRARIAALIMDGSLSLYETVAHTSAAPGGRSASSSSSQGLVYEPISPRKMQAPSNMIIEQEPSAKPATTQKVALINEQAQAEVLVAAAAQGAPLCELCKKQ